MLNNDCTPNKYKQRYRSSPYVGYIFRFCRESTLDNLYGHGFKIFNCVRIHSVCSRHSKDNLWGMLILSNILFRYFHGRKDFHIKEVFCVIIITGHGKIWSVAIYNTSCWAIVNVLQIVFKRPDEEYHYTIYKHLSLFLLPMKHVAMVCMVSRSRYDTHTVHLYSYLIYNSSFRKRSDWSEKRSRHEASSNMFLVFINFFKGEYVAWVGYNSIEVNLTLYILTFFKKIFY